MQPAMPEIVIVAARIGTISFFIKIIFVAAMKYIAIGLGTNKVIFIGLPKRKNLETLIVEL